MPKAHHIAHLARRALWYGELGVLAVESRNRINRERFGRSIPRLCQASSTGQVYIVGDVALAHGGERERGLW
jgi:hypothetical protein